MITTNTYRDIVDFPEREEGSNPSRGNTSSRPLVGEKNWWMMALDVVRRKLRRILRRRKGKQGGVFARADGKGGCAKEGGRAVGLHGISAYIIVSRRA